MPKLCDKCHIKPAVVHIRAMTPDGRRETSSYCLDCAMELFGHADIPADFREMLDELFQLEKNLKKHARKPRPEKKKEAAPPTCHHCGCVAGESYEKCGYCFASLRPFFTKRLPLQQDGRTPVAPPARLGCGPRIAFPEEANRARQLGKLLLIRETSFLKGRLDGVESVQDEISALRQEIMQAALAHRLQNTLPYLPSLLGKPHRTFHGGTLFPFLESEETKQATPLIRLAFSQQIYRTLVDPPGGFPDDPEACRRKTEELLALSPAFRGGYRWEGEPAIFSANGSIRALCGRTEDGVPAVADGRITFSLTVLPGEGRLLSLNTHDLMADWENHYHFFQDPMLGFFHPLGGICRAAYRLVLTLHLPALMALMGRQRLQNVLHYLEGFIPDGTQSPSLFLDSPPFLQGDSEEAFPSGFLILKDCTTEWDNFPARVKRLSQIVQTLEKREKQARNWFLHHSDGRENLLDAISQSRALLRGARTLSLAELGTALSRLWLGQELGCFPSLPRQRILRAVGFLLDRLVQGPVSAPLPPQPLCRKKLPLSDPREEAYCRPTWERSLLSWEEQLSRTPAPPQGAAAKEYGKLIRQRNQETTERIRQILETPEPEDPA